MRRESSKVGIRVAPLALLVVVACATVTQGTTESLVVESTPSGARVTIEPGGVQLETPGEVVLERGSRYRLKFELPGYETKIDEIFPQADGTTAGNLIVGGLYGMSRDLESGAAFSLFPNPVHAHLSPLPDGPSPAVDAHRARIVFFNTSNPAHRDRLAVAVALDDRHLATLGPYGQTEVAVEPGLHRLELRHREGMIYDDEYDLTVDDGVTFVSVFSRSFSTDFERLDRPPDGFTWSGPASPAHD